MTSNILEQLPGDNISNVIDKTFSAMGTQVTVAFCASDKEKAEEDIDNVKNEIHTFELQFSRFLSDSELSHLNNSDGKEFSASKEMIAILDNAQQWHNETNGIFDPSVIEALEYFGYDKSLDFQKGPVRSDANSTVSIDAYQNAFTHRARFRDVKINKEKQIIVLPKGLRIDLGGIGKGYIVDGIAKKLLQKYKNFWISAGGDMCLYGQTISGEPWQVNVQDPFHLESDIGHIIMDRKESRAIATSGIMKRKGTKGDFNWHHIIDPRTGLPARNKVVAVSVVAPTVVEADICAKVILILGIEKGMEFIKTRSHCDCIIIDEDKSIILSHGMKDLFVSYL